MKGEPQNTVLPAAGVPALPAVVTRATPAATVARTVPAWVMPLTATV